MAAPVKIEPQIPRIELTTMPMEAAAEILTFLAERESFDATQNALAGQIELEEVRAMLREVALQLRKISAATPSGLGDAAKHFTTRVKKLMPNLSPHEEKTLLRVFGLIDKR